MIVGINNGTFTGVAGAKAACEQHTARLQHSEDAEPVDVRIAPGRRRR
jgi:hypothetical protein